MCTLSTPSLVADGWYLGGRGGHSGVTGRGGEGHGSGNHTAEQLGQGGQNQLVRSHCVCVCVCVCVQVRACASACASAHTVCVCVCVRVLCVC